MIVSLTGVTGFVGWRAAECARDAGWRVRAIVRPGNRKALPDGVEAVEAALDPADPSALIRAADGSDVLVHVAGLVRAARAVELDAVNVGGTRAVVAAANAVGAHLVLVSSLAAAGAGTVERPLREDDTPHPVNAYGRSKLGGEAAVAREAIGPWTIIRPPAVYGPRDRGFLPLFRLASRGRFLLVAPPTTAFTLVHIDDLARAILLAATIRPAGECFFVGHPTPRTTEDILRGLAAAYARPYRAWRVPPPLVAAAARVGDVLWRVGVEPLVDSSRLAELTAPGFVCAVDRARDALGFRPEFDWPEGAEQTARWYRDRGWV